MQRSLQIARTIEIFADLNRRLQFGGELRITIEIVVDDRLLDPVQAKIVDHVAALQRLANVQALIEIRHQMHVVAHGSANGCYRGQIVADPLATEPQFEPGEAAFVAKLVCLPAQRLGLAQPQPVAVIRTHRSDRPAQENAKGHGRGLRERIPRCHIESGDRNHR